MIFRPHLLAVLAAISLFHPALRGQQPAEGSRPKGTPVFRFGVTLSDFEPTTDREQRQAELLYAFVSASFEKKGWGAAAEVRARDGKFRPYFKGSVWTDHVIAFLETPAGKVQVGQIPSVMGVPDDTFGGNLLSLNGHARNPEFGAALAGKREFGYNSLDWNIRYSGQNDQVGWEEQGRNVESHDGARLRDAVDLRVSYLVNKGLVTVRPGLSAFTNNVVGQDSLVLVHRSGLSGDLSASFGPLSVALLGLYQDGDPAAALLYGQTGLPRLAYDRLAGGAFSFRAEFPTVTYRYTYSTFSYRGTGFSESLHQPSVVWIPRKGIEATIEFESRRLDSPSEGLRKNAFRLGLGLSF